MRFLPCYHELREKRDRELIRAEEHIAEESDLVLVELGINDLVEMEVVDAYEHLIRGLLELPSKPAVINIEYVCSCNVR